MAQIEEQWDDASKATRTSVELAAARFNYVTLPLNNAFIPITIYLLICIYSVLTDPLSQA